MVQNLLTELHQRGIKLRLVDGRLDILAPAGTLTPELRERLTLRRDRLIALLRRAELGGDLPQIVPRPEHRHEPFPLTDIQHAYWVGRVSGVELGGIPTHYYFELERAGLDPRRLGESLRRVIERHDMLRAIVEPDGRQRILPEVPGYDLPVRDLRGVAPGEREAELARIRTEMGRRAPAAERWPLFDICACLLADDRLRLHVSVNLLIVDFVSLSLLFSDWRRYYESPDWNPAPLPLSYRDYVVAQEELRDGSRYRTAQEYWLARLDELPPAPDLPLARQPTQPAVEFVRRHARLPRERWESVKQTARRRGLTPSVVLLTVFADVLRRWSTRQSSMTLNLTLFDRPPLHDRIGEVVGDFTSLTMLAVDAPSDESISVRAERLNGQLMRDLEHLSYSGVRVLRERARRTGSGPGAAMPVVFTSAIGAPPADDRSFFGEPGYGISQTPQVWLDHQVMEEHGDLLFNWDAVDALFPRGMLDDMFATYYGLLDRLAGADDAWDEKGSSVSLPAWQAHERALANHTAREIPARTLGELVEAQIRRRPDAVAAVWVDGQLTYREVAEHGRRLARRLVALGARRDTLVGVALDKGWEQVPALLGVAWSGAAYLPIDPQWPEARRRQLLEQGGVRTVVTTPRLRDELAWPASVRAVTLTDDGVRDAEADPLDTGPSPRDLAYVIFTSGSTGQPKGVMIDHRGAANTIQDLNGRFGVGPADRVLALSALSFDLSVYDIFGTLAAGGVVVLPSPAGVHDPEHWSELMRRHGVTIWNSVPALMQAWVDSRHPASTPVPGLRLVLLSGDWIPVALPDAVRAHHPRADVISLGGATEASIWSVAYPIDTVPADWTRVPYGKPLANQTLHVYNERFEPCPVWTVGEIFIGGTGVAAGYWADPDRTAERFLVHPDTNERLYRTGDLGRYLPGGDIEFLGRADFQVKLNGYRIELGEIAAALRRQPGVADALARVATNPATGRRQLVAYVVPSSDGSADPARLREALDALLPGYMVPPHFLPIDRVPLSANGKVDPSALPAPWDQADGADRVAPRDDLERSLLEIWREVLDRDDLGVEDNFFELGADSLHAVRILGRLRDELGIEQEAEEGLQTLFESPTIAELAVTLRDRLAA